jgi:hypothetical protein
MLHRGFHTLAPKVLHKRPLGLLLLLEEKEIPNWQWYLRLALIDLIGWLVIFALLLLIANYTQNAFSPFLEQ